MGMSKLPPELELLALVAELGGAALGVLLGGVPARERLGLDLAVLPGLPQAIPELRRAVEDRLGRSATELSLSFADGVDQGLLRGPAGTLVALLERGLRLRELHSHRRPWQPPEEPGGLRHGPIARKLQLPHDGTVVTGPMLEAMAEEARTRAVLDASVFARISPLQKMQIVQDLQKAGRVVAMTGDGANDAAAIRLAEVGIALGSRATVAARSAADPVVTDGRIETIVHAVHEGRALGRSVRDAVGLLVSGLVEGRPPLNTRQLLLLNLLTDPAPALAISMRPPGAFTPQQRSGPRRGWPGRGPSSRRHGGTAHPHGHPAGPGDGHPPK